MSSTASLPILLTGDHWRITAITLYANTDIRDTLVRRKDHRLYRGGVTEPIEGSIFFLEDDLHGGAYVILADCTDYEQARLTVADGAVTVFAGTSRVTVIFCRRGECERACREEYRRGMKSRPLVTMSNTWGDGNRFTRVCEDFVRREIDKAAVLGIDIVQIDDGWQYGGTADPARRDKDGRRVFADDFWQINRERFPSGIAPLASYAAERGIRLGLWFAPESRDHFACLERDLANPHHYEYWYDVSPKSRTYEPVPMPLEYLKESFCDRVAASKIYKGDAYTDSVAYDYFKSRPSEKLMHPCTACILESWLKMLAEEGEEKTFAHIRKIGEIKYCSDCKKAQT